MTAGGGVSKKQWRWTEVDPWGHSVSCDEETWAEKAAERIELPLHEEGVRATIRDPDQVYFDAASTARRALLGRANVRFVHYVSTGRLSQKWTGTYLVVVVKWLAEDDAVRGYVQTMYASNRILPRLQLFWSRQS